MPRGDDVLTCGRCGSRQRCPTCSPTGLTPRDAIAEILGITARVIKPSRSDNAADAVLMETERMCRALLGARG